MTSKARKKLQLQPWSAWAEVRTPAAAADSTSASAQDEGNHNIVLLFELGSGTWYIIAMFFGATSGSLAKDRRAQNLSNFLATKLVGSNIFLPLVTGTHLFFVLGVDCKILLVANTKGFTRYFSQGPTPSLSSSCLIRSLTDFLAASSSGSSQEPSSHGKAATLLPVQGLL